MPWSRHHLWCENVNELWTDLWLTHWTRYYFENNNLYFATKIIIKWKFDANLTAVWSNGCLFGFWINLASMVSHDSRPIIMLYEIYKMCFNLNCMYIIWFRVIMSIITKYMVNMLTNCTWENDLPVWSKLAFNAPTKSLIFDDLMAYKNFDSATISCI